MRILAVLVMLAGCDSAALVFDVESDSLRPEEPRDPFGSNDLRFGLN